MSTAAYQKEWRARHGARTGIMGRPRIFEGCGSPAAYSRHVRKHEPIDDECRQAWSEYQKGRRDARELAAAKAEGPKALAAYKKRRREVEAKALAKAAAQAEAEAAAKREAKNAKVREARAKANGNNTEDRKARAKAAPGSATNQAKAKRKRAPKVSHEA